MQDVLSFLTISCLYEPIPQKEERRYVKSKERRKLYLKKEEKTHTERNEKGKEG